MKKIFTLITVLISCVTFFAACEDTDETPEITTPAYSITFVDENGKILDEKTVNEGSIPSYSYDIADTAEWDYSFLGWADSVNGQALSAIPAATADATYYAKVGKVKRTYTVSFETFGANGIPSQTVEYGNTAIKPPDPSYAGHKFMGWFSGRQGSSAFDFSAPVRSNVTAYALWNETVDVKELLAALLGGYKTSPYSFIPETLQPNYSADSVDSADVITDYGDFVDVSDIVAHGFGEQWNMILENINQSTVFHNALSIVDSVATASVAAFNNYIDSNPQDTASYTHKD